MTGVWITNNPHPEERPEGLRLEGWPREERQQAMLLKPDETDLIGAWIVLDGRVDGDQTEKRIGSLIADYLEKICPGLESGGWDVLYRDPIDGRFWELTYPMSHMHGGGPKRLTCLSPADAKAKYRLGS